MKQLLVYKESDCDQKEGEKRLINVLLVDDNPYFLKSAKHCLEQQGDLFIETALSGDEVFEKIEKKKPDVIVCDIQMPATNGFEVLKMLRIRSDYIPFIVFTITGKKELALDAFRLGVNGFIGKVGNPNVVYSQLKNCIESFIRISVNGKET